MYIPNAQSVLTAGLALTGTLTKRSSSFLPFHPPLSLSSLESAHLGCPLPQRKPD